MEIWYRFTRVDCFGFSRTGGGHTIRGVDVTADPVADRVIRKVAMMADPVADCTGYHFIGASVISGVAMMASTDAARVGYHLFNSHVCIVHGR